MIFDRLWKIADFVTILIVRLSCSL